MRNYGNKSEFKYVYINAYYKNIVYEWLWIFIFNIAFDVLTFNKNIFIYLKCG